MNCSAIYAGASNWLAAAAEVQAYCVKPKSVKGRFIGFPACALARRFPSSKQVLNLLIMPVKVVH